MPLPGALRVVEHDLRHSAVIGFLGLVRVERGPRRDGHRRDGPGEVANEGLPATPLRVTHPFVPASSVSEPPRPDGQGVLDVFPCLLLLARRELTELFRVV